jgi:hypothetical protein
MTILFDAKACMSRHLFNSAMWLFIRKKYQYFRDI